MDYVLQKILEPLVFIVAFALLWDFSVGIIGLIKKRYNTKKKVNIEKLKKLKFAIVIPAHNEGNVIGYLLSSIFLQHYPKDKFHVFVAADRCSDNTVEVSRQFGANVIERWQGVPGKTHNLLYAFSKIPLDQYDALIIIDADNILDLDFLHNLNIYLHNNPDAKAVQTYLDVKNPKDSWIPRAIAISYWITNSLWQDARDALMLSPTLGGTGMVLRTEFLLARGWNARSLTEDLELHAELVATGERVYWCHTAKVYDEKPKRILDSYRQRVRWYQGHFWVSLRYTLPLLKKVFSGYSYIERLRAFDTLLYLFAPWRNLLLIFLWLIFIVGSHIKITWLLFLLSFSFVSGLVASKARFGKITLEWAMWGWSIIPYSFIWFPVALHALLKMKNQDSWMKTPHESRVTVHDILK